MYRYLALLWNPEDERSRHIVRSLAERLELGPAPARSDPGRIARKGWAATWPKLLAIAIVLAIWELVALSGWKKYEIGRAHV